MVASLTNIQLASIYMSLTAVTFVCLIVLAALILIEYMSLSPEKKSLNVYKILAVTNLVTGVALIAYIYFVRSLHIPSNKFNGKLFMLAWFAVPLFLAGIEFFVYRKKLKELRQRKLLGLLLLINISSYFIFSYWFIAAQSYTRCGRRSPRIACTSNLKQIGLSLKQYAMDFDNYFPDKDGIAGLEQLRGCDYLTDNRVYVCPECDSSKKQGIKLSSKNCDYIYRAGLRETNVNAGKTPLVWDKPGNHKDYGNVLFMDGHVKGFSGSNWMKQAGIKKEE